MQIKQDYGALSEKNHATIQSAATKMADYINNITYEVVSFKWLYEKTAKGLDYFMQSILKELYYGRVAPFENAGSKDPESPALQGKISEEKEFFKSMMSDEDYKRLDKLETLYTEESELQDVEAFRRGFRLAALLMIEIFTNEKISAPLKQ